MSTDDERAIRRNERERQTIEALALIAPTPEMVRRVLDLRARTDGEVTPKRSTSIRIVPEPEPVTADR